jgi:hypothetical protein
VTKTKTSIALKMEDFATAGAPGFTKNPENKSYKGIPFGATTL